MFPYLLFSVTAGPFFVFLKTFQPSGSPAPFYDPSTVSEGMEWKGKKPEK
jgi:hypothetical protein